MKKVVRRPIVGNRLEYSMIGEVTSVNEKSILVKRQNSNAFFWIDKNEQHCPLNKGDMGCFTFNISTFISTQGQYEGLVTTKLRLSNAAVKSKPAFEGDEFLGGTLLVQIDEVIPASVEGLYLLRMTAKSNNETIWARYYNVTEAPKHNVTKVVKLRLMKTKLTMDSKGVVLEDQETREEDIGVGKVKVSYPRWFTWLEVFSIEDQR